MKDIKSVLMVLSHNDDEIIWGWPVYQMKDVKKFLIIASSDVNNPERQWAKRGKEVMLKLARENDIEAVCFDYDSEFYRLETRKGALSRFCDSIANALRTHRYDAVFTHNPHGEYGHLDHKLIFNTVFDHVPLNVPILYTDICQESNWPSRDSISRLSDMLFYQDKVMDCVLDEEMARKAEVEYRKAGCWTWDQKIVSRCGLYRI